MPSRINTAGHLFSVWYILHNIADITIKNSAKIFDGVGTDAFVSF